MGFRNRVNATWVKLQGGKFYIPTPGGKQILVNAKGITSHYETCDAVDCYLKSIKYKESQNSDFGPQWIFEFLTDDGEPFILAFSTMTYLPYSLMNSFASVEKFGKLELSAAGTMKDGKILTNVYIKNNNEDVRWKWKIDEIVQPVPLLDADGDPIIENGKQKRSFKKVIAHYQNVVLPGILEVLSQSTVGASSDDVEYIYDQEEPPPAAQPVKQPTRQFSATAAKAPKYPEGDSDDIPF